MSRPFGNTQGLKPSEVKALERAALRRSDRRRLVGVDLARELGELAWETGRNVGALVDRAGHVQRVLVGDMQGVPVPDLGAQPQPGRLSGIRLVRTELRGVSPIGDHDRALLVRNRFDALVRLVLDDVGEVLWVQHAFLDPARIAGDTEDRLVTELAAQRLSALSVEYQAELAALEEEISRRALGLHAATGAERALLVCAAPERLAELVELSRSALYDVAAHSVQRRARPDPRTWVGSGKVIELARLAVKHGASVVVFDHELTGMQQRNLEDRIGLPVIDRTDLVLRIFERRAQTRASRLRVELARLRYQLPRLAGGGAAMSRIGRSGVSALGTRGKGERRIDLDRRRMRERIHRFEALLERVARQQRTRRKRRERSGLPICSLVGYTNAGKSSWLNALADAEVLAEDLLFATLDLSVRRTRLPRGRDVLLSDTVGFLRELPQGLIDAFRSTLEELALSDLLIHIVDIAAPDWEQKEAAVAATLADLGAAAIPMLTLYNKADLADRAALAPIVAARGGVLVSVHDKADRVATRALIEDRLEAVAPGVDRARR